jgi:hypothetical protein
MQERRTAGWPPHGCESTVTRSLKASEAEAEACEPTWDAVPIKESTGLPYASDRTGTDRLGQATSIAHACGHDMHVVADGGGQKSYRRTAVLGAVR